MEKKRWSEHRDREVWLLFSHPLSSSLLEGSSSWAYVVARGFVTSSLVSSGTKFWLGSEPGEWRTMPSSTGETFHMDHARERERRKSEELN